MSFNINQFRANMAQGGLRYNLFDVTITNPIDGGADQIIPFRCRATDLPESDLNEVTASYKGRKVKFPGNRTYRDWQVQVQEDQDFSVRAALEAWNSAMNSHEGNVNVLPTPEASNYKSVANVRLYNSNAVLIVERQLIGVWARSIEPIQHDWDNDNVVLFNVVFSYDYWIPVTGTPNISV